MSKAGFEFRNTPHKVVPAASQVCDLEQPARLLEPARRVNRGYRRLGIGRWAPARDHRRPPISSALCLRTGVVTPGVEHAANHGQEADQGEDKKRPEPESAEWRGRLGAGASLWQTNRRWGNPSNRVGAVPVAFDAAPRRRYYNDVADNNRLARIIAVTEGRVVIGVA